MAHTMKVQMFGNFRMEFDGVPLIAEKMHKESQFNRLMQVMMHYAKTGIAKDKLEGAGYGCTAYGTSRDRI